LTIRSINLILVEEFATFSENGDWNKLHFTWSQAGQIVPGSVTESVHYKCPS